MKKILLICAGILFYANTKAQTTYTLTYTPGVGNPGALNTDLDDAFAGWTTLIAPAVATNQWSPSASLPFTFNYFGNPVTDFKASANGLITFSTTTTLPNDNVAIPSANLTDSTIACFWDAFTTVPPTASNDYVAWKIWGTAPNRQLWIKWASYEIGAPKADNASFMCMLEEGTDKIYLVEGAYTNTLTYILAYTTTAGIQLNSTTGLMYQTANRTRPALTTAVADNNVLTFTPYVKTNMSFTAATAIQPNTSNIPKNGSNEAIMRIDVDMAGELSPLSLTQIALNTAGTTTNADITNARVYYGGNDSSYSTAIPFGSTVSSPAGAFTVSGTQSLKMGRNYFWVAYSISNSATPNNIVDITCATVTIGGTPQSLAVSAPTGSRTIKTALNGTVNIGTGNTFVYLSDVFKEINANGLSGNTILSITSDIDDTAVASLTYAGNYTIKIIPSAPVFRNITGRFPSSLIELSGAQNVCFDGREQTSGTGTYLRFLNKDSLGSTFNFINGARFDTIKYCIIEGATYPLTKGVVNLGTSVGGTTGVRDIQFLNNDIRNRSDSIGVPSILIYSAGTTALNNGNLTINGNNLFNFRRSAVFIAFGDVNNGSFKITNNHMYYNAVTVLPNGDVVPIMFTPGVNSENNIISGNYIGGQAPFCGGSAWTASNDVYFVGMNNNAGFVTGTSIQGNTIQNINITLTTGKDFVAIRFESGKINIGTITGNIIGHPTTSGSITTSVTGLTMGIYAIYSSGDFTINNNTIANINALGASTSGLRGIAVQRGGGAFSVSNNSIYNLTTASAQTTPSTNALLGIGMLSTAEHATIIRNNKIYNLNTTNTTIAVQPSAIVLDQSSSTSGLIEGNIIYGMTNVSTSATATLNGMNIQGGVKNWIIRNNMISLTNGSNTNSMTIRGIADNNVNNANTYNNNSIYIGGTTATGALNSYAFVRLAGSAPSIRNNIFYNERTGGTGIHAAIGNIAATPATNWDANTSGYNLLITQNPATIGAWGSTFIPRSFTQLQDTSGGDKTSWSDVSATVSSNIFFKGVANGNLSLDTSNALCWYALGKGIALTGNNTDIDGNSRSVSVISGPVDIGADQVPMDNIVRLLTLIAPPNATVTGTTALGDVSTFTFAGRTIAKVYWNAGVTPSSVNMRYYTGVYPLFGGPLNNLGNGGRFNSYYDFSTTGGVFDADVKLYYDSALFGNVTNATSILTVAGTPYTPNSGVTFWSDYYASTTVDVAERSFRVNNLASLNRFTGTQLPNPLDVKLTLFDGTIDQQNANLYWQSVSEQNASVYEIERSFDGRKFDAIGTVKAINKASKYTFSDKGVFANNAFAYYRLKMVDNDGTFEYSNTIVLQTKEDHSLNASVYPNPYAGASNLEFTSAIAQQATITISDIQGRVINTKNITTQVGINTISVDLQNERGGIYFIQLITNGNTFQTKIIK
jgi:hypothetical protein